MSESHKANAVYVMGRSAHKTRRLQEQAQIYGPSTHRLFVEAGIRTGMKVLEVGCGAGDMALLTADFVGPQAAVVGVDLNPTILQTAQTRVQAAGVTFIHKM